MTSKTNLNTELKIFPSRSQVVLVLLTLLSAGCFFSGFAFLWQDKGSAWVPILIGTCIFVFVAFAWYRAQKDTDLENSKPTIFKDGSGNQLATDTRALLSLDGIQNLERFFCVLAHRNPLPEPDGLIDKEGNPIPSTKEEARNRVAAANKEARTVAERAVDLFAAPSDRESGVQPLIDEPYSEDLVRTNTERK